MPEKRQRRDQRAKIPRPMVLTERDKQVIKAVCDYRVLRQDQLQRLFFTSKNTCQRVLQRLYQHKFLHRVFLPVTTGSPPTLYCVDKEGVQLLSTEFGYGDLKWYPTAKDIKPLFIDHVSSINDVRIAVTLAAQKHGYSLKTWLTDNELKADYDYVQIETRYGRKKVAVIPDSYFVLETPHGKAHFFIELDRRTESIEKFQHKVQAYLAYWDSRAYEKRYNTKALRVLTVTIGQERLNHLKAVTEKVDKRNWFWFGLLSELNADSVLSAPIWQRAGQDGLYTLIEAD